MDELIRSACERGGILTVKDWIDKGGSVNAKVGRDYPLYWSSLEGHNDLVQLLLDSGAMVDGNKGGTSPLFAACSRGHVSIARLLLERGANTELRTKIESHYVDQDTPPRYNGGETALCHVSRLGNIEMLNLLLDYGANIHNRGEHGWSPLYGACEAKKVEAVRVLVARGANIFAKNENFYSTYTHGETPLHRVVTMSPYDEEIDTIMDLLLDSGAYKDVCNNDGQTPLHLACAGVGRFPELAHSSAVKQLVNRGAEIDAKDKYGRTPLHFACAGGVEYPHLPNVEAAILLLDNGADIEAKDKAGDTPLHLANGKSIINLLLQRGANYAAVDNLGKTPLETIVDIEDRETLLAFMNKTSEIRSSSTTDSMMDTDSFSEMIPTHKYLSQKYKSNTMPSRKLSNVSTSTKSTEANSRISKDTYEKPKLDGSLIEDSIEVRLISYSKRVGALYEEVNRIKDSLEAMSRFKSTAFDFHLSVLTIKKMAAKFSKHHVKERRGTFSSFHCDGSIYIDEQLKGGRSAITPKTVLGSGIIFSLAQCGIFEGSYSITDIEKDLNFNK